MRLCSWMLLLLLSVACYVAGGGSGSSKALETFLTGAAASGRTQFEVTAPGGTTLARGADLTPEAVDAAIATHASGLPVRKRAHEYEVRATTPDGGGLLLHQERRAGGVPDEDDAHRVDAERVQNAGQAMGHLVKALVACVSELREDAHDARSHAAKMSRENRRLHRMIMASEGELGLAAMVLRGEQAESAAKRGMWEPFLKRVLTLGEGALSKAKLLPPNEQANLVAAIRADLKPVQRASIRRIVGDEAWEAIGWAQTPDELADVLFELGEDKLREILVGAGLEDAQRDRVILTCMPRWKERKAAKDKAASESASSSGHGAPGEPATGTGASPPPAASVGAVDPHETAGGGADSGVDVPGVTT